MFRNFPYAKFARRLSAGALLVAAALLPMLWQQAARSAEAAVKIPAPTSDEPVSDATSETAVLAGGCFWGVQGVFQHVKGVSKAMSGYAGGAGNTAHYEKVGMGTTGHAESVQVTFDPHQISYGQILQIYFSVAHDPTQRNRQGPDTGTQYRSAIFPMNEAQKAVAKSYVAQLDQSGVYGQPIATTIEPGKSFYAAEPYHQDFLARNPTYGYIVANDLPKIANLKQVFPERYRETPSLVMVSVH
ncbi:MAG: peptide-methionine (S)-S-oxide reductase MsrA [Dokdonella sp.]